MRTTMSKWKSTSQMERTPTYIPIAGRIPKIYTIASLLLLSEGEGVERTMAGTRMMPLVDCTME